MYHMSVLGTCGVVWWCGQSRERWGWWEWVAPVGAQHGAVARCEVGCVRRLSSCQWQLCGPATTKGASTQHLKTGALPSRRRCVFAWACHGHVHVHSLAFAFVCAHSFSFWSQGSKAHATAQRAHHVVPQEPVAVVEEPAPGPDEEVYCYCQRVYFGDMIGCDNDDCPIEWFHFECVGLTEQPKGTWYCPDCRATMESNNKRRKR
mgnify:CR=1 FL=1